MKKKEYKQENQELTQRIAELEQDNSELNNLHFQYQNENNSLEIENSELKNELEKQKNHNPFDSIDINHDLQSIIIRKLNEYRYYNIIDGSIGTAQRQYELRNEVVGLRNENAELKKELEEYKKDKDFWDKYSKISINELQEQEPKPRDVKEIMEFIKANPEIEEILLYRKMGNDNSCLTKDIVEIGILLNNTFGITLSDIILMNIIRIQIGNQHFDIEDFI